jgi:uncharacterized membrane protein
MVIANDTSTATERLIGGLGRLEESLIAAAWMAAFMSLVIGIVFLAVGIWVYFNKIKGKPKEGVGKPSGLLSVAYLLAILIGALMLLYGIFQMIILLLMPTIAGTMAGSV